MAVSSICLMTSDVEHFFHVFIDHFYVSGEVLVQFL